MDYRMDERNKRERMTECIAYFSARDGYRRAFTAVRQKWQQYGRAAGVIKLEQPTKEERETLEGFFARELNGAYLRFTVKEFAEALKQSRFGWISLEELLCAYFGEPLESNQKRRERESGRKQTFFCALLEQASTEFGPESDAVRWLSAVLEYKKYGYQLILKSYSRQTESSGQAQARMLVHEVCGALRLLKQEPQIRLAVLADRLTHNPHAFDRNTAAGKLLIQALSFLQDGMEYQTAEELLQLYYAAGIRPDDISSFTTVYGIHFYTEQGEHPAYRAFVRAGEPCVVTLSNLSRILRADAANKIVYAVENQMVFSHLCEALAGAECGLICTSGQVKTASLMLLDLLCESGCRIYYSGDLDPEGIGIAQRLLARHPRQVQPWHMTKEDYVRARSKEGLSQERLQKLNRVQDERLREVKEAVLLEQKAGYQERLLEELLADIRRGL